MGGSHGTGSTSAAHIERERIGIELPPNVQGKLQSATEAAHAPLVPELATLISAWPSLPEPIRAGILALVRAAGG